MNGTVLGKAVLRFVWRFFKWLLVQSAIFCVLVLIFYYVVMNLLFGRSRLEWVDDKGRGNIGSHWLLNEAGREVLGYRLSDYSNTNKIYSLQMWCRDKRNAFPLEVTGSVFRTTTTGLRTHLHMFVLRPEYPYDPYNTLSVELPSIFAPEDEGETLEIDIVLPKEVDGIRTIHIRHVSEKVWHFVSV